MGQGDSNTSGDRVAPSEPAPLSLDDQIKQAQRDKLRAEVRQLTGLSMETVGKLLVAVFGILAAAFALWTGVPQTRLDLAKAQEDLFTKKQELSLRAAELAETEGRRARSADELARLQAEIAALGKELESRRVASGKPPEPALAQRIEQATKPRVFVQFAGDLNRVAVIDPLRDTLASQGLVVPAAERINKGQSNEVRYFSQAEDQRQLAQKVADTTKAYFERAGCPLPGLQARYVALPDGRQSPVELWLMHSCPAR